MNRLLCVIVLLNTTLSLYSQINIADSTAQVVAYWYNGESLTYNITFAKYQINEEEVSDKETVDYKVTIDIIDSTESNYKVRWTYNDFKVSAENEFLEKLYSIQNGLVVNILTDEMGTLQEVINWEDIRDHIEHNLDKMFTDLDTSQNTKILKAQLLQVYTSQASIEQNAIKDIRQFHTFHGAKYGLNQSMNGSIKINNTFGGAPFDSDINVRMDEINLSKGNIILRMVQRVNSQQFTDAMIEHLLALELLDDSQDASQLVFTNDIFTGTRIDVSSGWPLYSKEVNEVSTGNISNVEERIISIIEN